MNISGLNTTTYLKALGVELVFDANQLLQYVGIAAPGSATSSAVWRILKLTYDVNSNLARVKYAEGTNGFVHIFDNYASFTYS